MSCPFPPMHPPRPDDAERKKFLLRLHADKGILLSQWDENFLANLIEHDVQDFSPKQRVQIDRMRKDYEPHIRPPSKK